MITQCSRGVVAPAHSIYNHLFPFHLRRGALLAATIPFMIDASFIRGNAESNDLCRKIAEESHGVCLLSFSRGKDALAAWLNLSRFFRRIIPFTCGAVPGIPFADEYLDYLERIFDTRIIRIQDSGLFDTVNALTFQYPHDEEMIDGLGLPSYDPQVIAGIIRGRFGLPHAWTAYGLNASDSIDRMTIVRACHGRRENNRSFYPNFDWTHTQIMEALKEAGIKLSNEYHIASRSFAGGLMPNNLLSVEKRAPKLLARLEHFYPLIKASLARAHWRNEKCLKTKQRKNADKNR